MGVVLEGEQKERMDERAEKKRDDEFVEVTGGLSKSIETEHMKRSCLQVCHSYWRKSLDSMGHEPIGTRSDTRHKMRLVCVLFNFQNNTGHTDLLTDGRTDGPTDTTSYRDATAHLKRKKG